MALSQGFGFAVQKKKMALQVILVSKLMVNCVLKNISVAVKFNSFYTCTTVASKLVESQPERVK